jgi:hypothetical protein
MLATRGIADVAAKALMARDWKRVLVREPLAALGSRIAPTVQDDLAVLNRFMRLKQ